jgi:hypothetical protein
VSQRAEAAYKAGGRDAVRVWCRKHSRDGDEPLGVVRATSDGLVFAASMPVHFEPGVREELRARLRGNAGQRLPIDVARSWVYASLDGDGATEERETARVHCSGEVLALDHAHLIATARAQKKASRPERFEVSHI